MGSGPGRWMASVRGRAQGLQPCISTCMVGWEVHCKVARSSLDLDIQPIYILEMGNAQKRFRNLSQRPACYLNDILWSRVEHEYITLAVSLLAHIAILIQPLFSVNISYSCVKSKVNLRKFYLFQVRRFNICWQHHKKWILQSIDTQIPPKPTACKAQ